MYVIPNNKRPRLRALANGSRILWVHSPTDLAVSWHLIGTLQRNKARHAAGRFVLIHSVDRADLATELHRRVGPDARQAVLVQVNCSDEPQKGGVEPDGLLSLLDQLQGLDRLDVQGLMTMSALTEDVGE